MLGIKTYIVLHVIRKSLYVKSWKISLWQWSLGKREEDFPLREIQRRKRRPWNRVRASPEEDSIKPHSKFALSHYTPLECTSVQGVNRSIQTHSLTCQGQHQHIMKALAVNNASPRHNRLSKWMRLILKWTAATPLPWTNTSGQLHTRDMTGSWKKIWCLGGARGNPDRQITFNIAPFSSAILWNRTNTSRNWSSSVNW